ncbi:hypothetical protein RHGRI_017774 [Rhododendron griersonianum]|uniref:Uncharacterized protein n=1 Tax=Rhododendron griersonianum TaxID=479676 RepID=A0AAV6JZ03_9ERIC|nr:hypothetical protein RHGRI_017774 [Rhododendron griersonianum]
MVSSTAGLAFTSGSMSKPPPPSNQISPPNAQSARPRFPSHCWSRYMGAEILH